MRQLLERLAGPMPHYSPGPLQAVVGRAPLDINVYTDGGLRHQPQGPAAMGNWGLFAAEMITPEDSALLERSGWRETCDACTTFWGQLDGHPISSTRSEGWGIIAAHMLPIPVHAGVDNRGAVANATNIIEGKVDISRRPWAMRPDGDMWGLLHEMIAQRGPAASRASKVRGHATVAMVREGTVREQDRRGNCAADGAVERGCRT